MKSTQILAAASLAVAANAQSPVYGQCGGKNWTGPTTCVAGSYCAYSGEFYSQCLPGSAPGGTTSASTAAPTSGTPTTLSTVTSKPATTSAPPQSSDSSNPLAGKSFYVNNFYSSEVISIAIPSLVAEGKTSLVPKASAVAKVPSFYWMDTRAKVPKIADFAKDAATRIAAGEKLSVPLVVYDLPNRDCAALASNGELSLDNNGATLYKGYIDSIKTQISAYPTVHFTLAIEPDSLANLVTNLDKPKCSAAASAYKELTTYAIQTLDLPNVSMYLDAGHAGWLGWTANQDPAVKVFSDLYKAAGSPKAVRGLVTNVSNYNAWKIASCPTYAESNQVCDESKYINALAPKLKAAGFPAHFLVDTSRNGVQPTKQIQWGDWCNVIGTGFGIRPSTSTDDPLLDAWVWVKPGGEADGTSDTSAVRYDAKCGEPDALKPAPEAGSWFQAYFEQLLVNANPAF